MAGHKPSTYSSTMATTNILIDPITRVTKLSPWSNLKRWALHKLEASPFLQLLCCVDANELALYRQGEDVRSHIREEMREHMGYANRDTCLLHAIDEVVLGTGYDLSNAGTIRDANKGVKRTMADWDKYFRKLGVSDPITYLRTADANSRRRACIVPKFAAACSLHIRAKLGALLPTEANMLLVQRKYLEICRKHNVRDVDTVLHQQLVLNAVFTESVLDEVATCRRRVPQWVRWLDSSIKVDHVSPTIC